MEEMYATRQFFYKHAIITSQIELLQYNFFFNFK